MAEPDGLATLLYGPSHFDVVRVGRFVLCAETRVPIPIEELTYWSAEFQEAYRGPQEATRSLLRRRAEPVA